MVLMLDGSVKSPFATHIRNDLIRRNKNFMGVWVGQTGSGKSLATISLAEDIDRNFSVDNICVSTKEMIERITSGELKKGSALVLDETGVNYSAKNWMKKENKYLGELFQTFRYLNYALLLNLPHVKFMDITERRLVHAGFEMKGIDRKNKLSYAQPKIFKSNPFSEREKFGFSYPIIRYPNGRFYIVKTLYFKLPTKKIRLEYLEKKKIWNQGLQDKVKRAIVYGEDVEMNQKKKDNLEVKYEIDDKVKKVCLLIKNNIDEYLRFDNRKGIKKWVFNKIRIKADYEIKGNDVERAIIWLEKDSKIAQYLFYKSEKTKAEREEKKAELF